MKPFEMPVIKVEKFSVEDIVTVSGYENETPLLPNSDSGTEIKAF